MVETVATYQNVSKLKTGNVVNAATFLTFSAAVSVWIPSLTLSHGFLSSGNAGD
jgi:hypothetical protein